MWVFFKPNAFKSWKLSYFIEQLKNLPFVLRDAVVARFLRHAQQTFLNRNDFHYAVQSCQRCLIAQPYSFHTARHRRFQRVWNLIFLVLPVLGLSEPFPAACPHFLTRFEQELYSRTVWTSEEANVKMKSKRRAVKIKWSVASRWIHIDLLLV